MKKHADRKRGPTPKFHPGDLIYIDATHLPTNRPSQKLDFKRHGPLKILKQISSHAYQVQRPATWSSKIHDVFHVDLLSPAQISESDMPEEPPPIQIPGETHLEYLVDKILDDKIIRGKRYYLIHWQGYDDIHDSWEPEENCSNAQDKINEYNQSKKNKAQRNQRKRPSRSSSSEGG